RPVQVRQERLPLLERLLQLLRDRGVARVVAGAVEPPAGRELVLRLEQAPLGARDLGRGGAGPQQVADARELCGQDRHAYTIPRIVFIISSTAATRRAA